MNKNIVACVTCKAELTTNNYKRHVDTCNGSGKKLDKLAKDKKQKQKQSCCKECNKTFRNAYSQASHLRFCGRPFESLGRDAKRNLLMEEVDYKCTKCGFCKTREDGKSILEIDHIDGDHTNNSKENLRVLCPNCHALTPNFRNWGRTSKHKTSKRLRKGNKDFKHAHLAQLVEQRICNAQVVSSNLTMGSKEE